MDEEKLIQAISNLIIDRIDDCLEENLKGIYTWIEHMDKRMDHFEERMDRFEERMDRFEDRLDLFEVRVNRRLDEIEARLVRVEEKLIQLDLIIENEIRPDIRLLSENYVPAASRYETASEKLYILETDVGLIKGVVADHSKRLDILAAMGE